MNARVGDWVSGGFPGGTARVLSVHGSSVGDLLTLEAKASSSYTSPDQPSTFKMAPMDSSTIRVVLVTAIAAAAVAFLAGLLAAWAMS